MNRAAAQQSSRAAVGSRRHKPAKTAKMRDILLPYQRRWVDDDSPLKIWLAARQIGKSFSLAWESVSLALSSRCNILLLSTSERQSKELMEKIYGVLRVFKAVSPKILEASRESRSECKLKTGSRIISLPASPETVRGFSGHVFLDEFAQHTDDREIWRAMYPTITRGYKLRIASTPRGKQNMFYELWTHAPNFSRHKTSIYDAIAEGLKVDLEELKDGMRSDPDGWAQEFECAFIDESTAFVPYDLIDSCEHENATLTCDPKSLAQSTYIGVDIGRVQDLTVIWVLEKVGDVLWTKAVECISNAKFKTQRDAISQWVSVAQRACIDSTGIGMQLAEELQEEFGKYKIEAVSFSSRIKEELAFALRKRMEDRLIRLPRSPEIRADFHAIKKLMTSAGNLRFDAEHTQHGHSDRFWACALANRASGELFQKPDCKIVVQRKTGYLEGF